MFPADLLRIIAVDSVFNDAIWMEQDGGMDVMDYAVAVEYESFACFHL